MNLPPYIFDVDYVPKSDLGYLSPFSRKKFHKITVKTLKLSVSTLKNVQFLTKIMFQDQLLSWTIKVAPIASWSMIYRPS